MLDFSNLRLHAGEDGRYRAGGVHPYAFAHSYAYAFAHPYTYAFAHPYTYAFAHPHAGGHPTRAAGSARTYAHTFAYAHAGDGSTGHRWISKGCPVYVVFSRSDAWVGFSPDLDRAMDVYPAERPMKGSIARQPALPASRLIGALGAGLALTIGIWLLLAMGNQWASWLAPAPTPASPAARADDVVAIVDGEAITIGEWSRTLAIHRTMSRLAGKAEPEPEEVLQQLIDQRLVLRWARSKGLSIRLEAAAERLQAMLSAWNVSEPQLDEALGSAGLSRQDLLQEIQRLMQIEQALPELRPSPEAWLAQQRARSRISVYRPMAAVKETVREKRPAEPAPTPQASPITTPTPAGSYPDPQAPDFALPDLEGKTFRLADLRGRPVILYFWATWCPVCRQETPALAEVDQRYRALGIALLGINLRERPENVQGFVRSFGLAFPILLDGDGSVAARYQVTGIPTTIFIDPSGVVRARHVGPIPESQWEEYIRRILPRSGEPSAPPDVGEIAPDFALPRENGEILRLSDYRGRSRVVLVFYRSPG